MSLDMALRNTLPLRPREVPYLDSPASWNQNSTGLNIATPLLYNKQFNLKQHLS